MIVNDTDSYRDVLLRGAAAEKHLPSILVRELYYRNVCILLVEPFVHRQGVYIYRICGDLFCLPRHGYVRTYANEMTHKMLMYRKSNPVFKGVALDQIRDAGMYICKSSDLYTVPHEIKVDIDQMYASLSMHEVIACC